MAVDHGKDVLTFWFGGPLGRDEIPRTSSFWFAGGEETDRQIRDRFGGVLADAAAGRLDGWAATPRGRLALILVLDQFSRNMHRGTPQAFSQDERALWHARTAVTQGEDQQLALVERVFLYLPFEHAEELACQEESLRLFTTLAAQARTDESRTYLESTLRYAARHEEIIRRFGRFPHRNGILARETTAEERTFLNEALSSF